MSTDNCGTKLPIIDLSEKSLKPGTSSWNLGCEKVRHALEDYGCFEATYDDLTSDLHDDVFESLDEVFDLPLETKLRNTSDKPYHGYYGNQPSYPVYESLGIVDPHIMSQAQSFSNLMWPHGNAKFCESINAYSKLVSKLDALVQSMVFESYGVKHHFDSSIESTYYVARPIKYRVPMKGEPSLGAFPHTDKSFLTILHQNDVTGLQVQTKDGQWIVLDPFTSSFIVMAGEASLAWSNGRIHAALHKVVMSEDKDRFTMASFSFNKGIIDVPEELVNDETHPRQYKSFDHLGMLRYYANSKGREVNTIRDYCGL